ncbi:hypothetical protein KP77_04070 [Jeotgalibacillus alimentarius]|uniref:Uncharacterized protein n=1 Tax=Jeotgalibacillus alimentarius TaxID=135826 RepID=A0A0C2WA21_9BACL|nr:hypothetical protein [Jeotgalibacillus alimentarius]KIL53431.1 hypothetical protein KP77_04070 [Jeotgalibacillus alimentarius]
MEFIIMAVVAAVFSLLSKQKKEETSEQKPPVQKPTVSKPRNLKETFDQHAKKLAEEYEKQRKSFENSSTSPRQEKKETVPQKKQPEPIKEIAVESRKTKRPADPIKESDITISRELKPRDVVNGIIFSEVLGPPRSKRRHRER